MLNKENVNRGSIPIMKKKSFISSPKCPDRLWGTPSLLPSWYRGIFHRWYDWT